MEEPGKEGRAPAVGDDGVFEIDRVVDIMWTNEEDDTPQYRVRWKGFPPIEDTWEPIENFTTASRRTVREFVRHYTKLQMKESRFQREIGQGNGKLCRHVNILSREVLTISSMRCDTTRQPPLWFYLVAWRNERPEDATWESEVYLRHASDLIHQYRAKHPTSPSTTLDCASRSPRGLALPATTSQKLFLDGPAPRKQKEKIAFVDNLIDDSVSMGQAKSSKGTQSKKRQVPCSKKHGGDDIFGNSKNVVEKGTKPIKIPSYSTLGTNAVSSSVKLLSVDGSTEDANRKKVADHHKIGKSYSASSRNSKPQAGLSTSRHNEKDTERNAYVEIVPSGNLVTGEIVSPVRKQSDGCSKDRFKRIIIECDTSGSSDNDASKDNINFYKSKFIRDEKQEEKKRRIRLMESRKETDVEKSTKKMHTLNVSGMGKTQGSKENRHNERPFSEKDQSSKIKLSNATHETNAMNSNDKLKIPTFDEIADEDYLKSKNKTKSRHDENHGVHKLCIIEKIGNIFGYDTDSEDLTLSPESYCSSVERYSPLDKSGISRLSLSGDCSPVSSVSSHSNVQGNEKCSKDICTATNVKKQSANTSSNNCSSNSNSSSNSSSNVSVRKHRSSVSNKKSSHSKRHSTVINTSGDKNWRGIGYSNNFERSSLSSKGDGVLQLDAKKYVAFQSTSLLSGLQEYDPPSSKKMSVEPDKFIQPNGDYVLAAINRGDCDTLLQILSLPDLSLPSLPFLRLLTEAIEAEHSGVAQVLAALSWGVDGPAPHNQGQWERVVEAAAAKGDLSLLLVLSALSGSLGDSLTCAPTSLSRGLQQCAQGGAQRCAQQHVLAALNTSRLTF